MNRDHTRIAHLARDAGWDVLTEEGSTVIERGPERIEVEYSTAGIPRTVRRTHPDGKREVISQNYISMTDLFGWITA